VKFLLPGLAVILLASCSKEPPKPGGGSHELTGLEAGTRWKKPAYDVGDAVPLFVEARWAIPSISDVTREAVFSVSPPGAGLVSAGVFHPAKTGEAIVTASFQSRTAEVRFTIQPPGPAKDGLPKLIEALASNSLNDRYFAAQEIAKLGPEAGSAIPALVRMLDTKEGMGLEGPARYYADARSVAAQALGAIGPGARAAAEALHRLEKEDPSPQVMRAASEALAKIEGR